MKKNQKISAVHVLPKVSGRPDGVEYIASCVISKFETGQDGNLAELKEFPQRYECKLIASRSNGTVSLSIHGAGEIVTVRLEDLENLLKATQ